MHLTPQAPNWHSSKRKLPIVSIAREEWTKMKVEQLASTRAISAVAIALPVIDRPGHPKPYRYQKKTH